jgi:hypothetical protein
MLRSPKVSYRAFLVVRAMDTGATMLDAVDAVERYERAHPLRDMDERRTLSAWMWREDDAAAVADYVRRLSP